MTKGGLLLGGLLSIFPDRGPSVPKYSGPVYSGNKGISPGLTVYLITSLSVHCVPGAYYRNYSHYYHSRFTDEDTEGLL